MISDGRRRLDLLVRGVDISLIEEGIQRVSGRVSVCNGIFLYEEGKQSGLKVKIASMSPYKLVVAGEKYNLLNLDGSIYWAGIKIERELNQGRWIKKQLSGVFAVTLYGCNLVNKNGECNFCSAPKYTGPKMTVDEYIADLEKVKGDSPNSIESMTINAGSLIDERYKGYEKMVSYIRATRDAGVRTINIELMPDDSLSYEEVRTFQKRMQEDGVTSVQYNIEVWDQKKAEEIMPLKGKIPRQTYLLWLQEAVKVFGKGKASSVLLLGLNSVSELSDAVDALLARDVYPSVEIFKALPGTKFAEYKLEIDYATTLPFIDLVRTRTASFFSKEDGEGCVKCGGCRAFASTYQKR